MGLFLSYKRLRHSRGFGIHSPWAYRFVTEAIRPHRGYAYYAYRSAIMRRPLAVNPRLLFRVILHLRPKSVTIAAPTEMVAAYEDIVKIAAPEAEIKASGGELLICVGMSEAVLDGTRHAVFTNKRNKGLSRLTAGMQRGHVYLSRRAAIVADCKAPFQRFDISY